MNVEINLVAVVLAMFASMVVGAVWYMPAVFGSTWMKLAKVNPKDSDNNGMKPMFVTMVVSLATAYVLAHVAYLSNQFFGNSFMQDALTTAFWVWLGFTAARMVTHDAFEGRPVKLTVLNAAHELLTFLVMAWVIGLVGL